MQENNLTTVTEGTDGEGKKKKGIGRLILDTIKDNGVFIGGATLLVAGGITAKHFICGKKKDGAVPVLDCPSDVGMVPAAAEEPADVEEILVGIDVPNE